MCVTNATTSTAVVAPKTYEPPVGHCMVRIDALPGTVMGRVIGKQASNFLKIQEATGASFLWYDRESQKIEVWGETEDICEAGKQGVLDAMNQIVVGRTNTKYGRFVKTLPMKDESLIEQSMEELTARFQCTAITKNPTDKEIMVHANSMESILRATSYMEKQEMPACVAAKAACVYKSIDLTIPRTNIGMFVGKNFGSLRDIAHATGCTSVLLDQDVPENAWTRVVIAAKSTKELEHAEQMVQSRIKWLLRKSKKQPSRRPHTLKAYLPTKAVACA